MTPLERTVHGSGPVRGDLGRIAVPTLVVSTAQDTLVTPYHHREVADGIEQAEYAELASGQALLTDVWVISDVWH